MPAEWFVRRKTQCAFWENPEIIELFCKTPALLQWVPERAAAFNGPLSFPNWRRDHFAYSDEVPFPQDECVLHTLLHFYLLVVIVEEEEKSPFHLLFLLLLLASPLLFHAPFPCRDMTCFTNPRQIPQNSVEYVCHSSSSSSLLTHATCKLDTFFSGFFSLRRHFFLK